jgi:hypothetical protein
LEKKRSMTDLATSRPRLEDARGVTVPAAVSVFANEMYLAPRSWTEQAYPNLIYFNDVEKGNHFAAWQEPELFVEEVRAGLGSLR